MILAGIIAAKTKPFVLHLNVLRNNDLSQHWEVSFCESSQILFKVQNELNKQILALKADVSASGMTPFSRESELRSVAKI